MAPFFYIGTGKEQEPGGIEIAVSPFQTKIHPEVFAHEEVPGFAVVEVQKPKSAKIASVEINGIKSDGNRALSSENPVTCKVDIVLVSRETSPTKILAREDDKPDFKEIGEIIYKA